MAYIVMAYVVVAAFTGRVGSRQQLAENVWLHGAPGVFWRYPAGFWGQSTSNLTLGTPLFWKKGQFFLLHTCRNWPGESAPWDQAHLWRPNRPQCAKRHAIWQSLSSRTEELQTFPEKIFRLFFITGVLFAVFALLAIWLAYYLAVPAAPGLGRLNVMLV